MTPDTMRFRTRAERENEVFLERNYRQIGISAIRAVKAVAAEAKRREPAAAEAAAR